MDREEHRNDNSANIRKIPTQVRVGNLQATHDLIVLRPSKKIKKLTQRRNLGKSLESRIRFLGYNFSGLT